MWKRGIAMLPGIGVSLLPKLACPMCWPAYAGLVSALGLGFVISTKYLLPLTVAFLAIAAAALSFRASRRHGCSFGRANPSVPVRRNEPKPKAMPLWLRGP